MFTLKIIDGENREKLVQAKQVGYNSEESPPTLWYGDTTSDSMPVTEAAIVYVMNEQGKTVATYRLGRFATPAAV